jgi:hypothetical protein
MRRAGFSRVDFNPDTCNKSRILRWDDAARAKLRKTAGELASYLETLHREGRATFTCPHLSFFPRAHAEPAGDAWWHRFESTILGADGRFYPCESLFQFPYETLDDFQIGDINRGLDRKRQDACAEEARAFITSAFGDRKHYCCPMNVYFYARRSGEDPAALIAGLMRVFEALVEPMLELDRRCPGVFGTPGVVR